MRDPLLVVELNSNKL